MTSASWGTSPSEELATERITPDSRSKVTVVEECTSLPSKRRTGLMTVIPILDKAEAFLENVCRSLQRAIGLDYCSNSQSMSDTMLGSELGERCSINSAWCCTRQVLMVRE